MTTTDRVLLEQAVEELLPVSYNSTDDHRGQADKAIALLRAALATQPKPLFADLIAQHEGLAEELAAMDTQPSGPAMLTLPTSESEAEAMQKAGYAWLAQHAPHRLKSQPSRPAWHDAPTVPGL